MHQQKNISTLGEGGILVVKDDKNASFVSGLRHNGHTPFGEREKYWKPSMVNVKMDIDGVWPFNYSMTEVQAALGSKLINRLDILNKKRRERAIRFINSLSAYPEIKFQKTLTESQNVFHLLPAIYIGDKFDKSNDDLIQLMSQKYKIKLIVQFYPLYRYPLFVDMGFSKAECPNTDFFYDNMISFPFHHWMSDQDFEYMLDSTKNALEDLRI